jgi:hypothetical protein
MRKEKCSFFSDFVKENSNNQGTLFKAIKGMLVGKNAISFPEMKQLPLTNLANILFRKSLISTLR